MLTKLNATCFFRRLLLGLVLLISLLSSRAQAREQGDKKLTLEGNGLTFRQVFSAIKAQTGYSIMYNQGATHIDQQEKVDVSFRNTPLTTVLQVLFTNRGLSWTFNDNVLVLFKKKSLQSADAPAGQAEGDSARHIPLLVGTVTDPSGAPVVGATVQIKASGQGTTTDRDGKFILSRVTTDDRVFISYIGYQSREIPVSGSTLLIQMVPVVNELDETVVVAYSTTTKRLSTGNVTTIKGEEIAKQPVSNPLLALVGRVPGLFIQQVSGVSGSAVNILIQGQNSIANGTDPFYVIDGVPYSSQLLYNIGGIYGRSSGAYSNFGNPLSYINPSDIESISVLKDADATAIYGSRAANGAILITTKKGKAGNTRVDVNLQQGWGKVTRKMKLLNTSEFLMMRHEAIQNDGLQVRRTDYDINGTWDTTKNTDWQKELIGGTAKYTTVSATVSGGTVQTQYLIGATFRRETFVFPGDFHDQKGSVHFNTNSVSANQKFSVQLSGNYMVDDNHSPQSDLTGVALQLAPTAPAPFNNDGTLNWALNAVGAPTWQNPLAQTVAQYNNLTKNLVTNMQLGYKILDGLELKTSLGYTDMQVQEINTFPLDAIAPNRRGFITRATTFGNNKASSWIIEPQLVYKTNIKKSKMEALIGTSIQQNRGNVQQIYATGYTSDQTLKDIGAAADLTTLSSQQFIYKYNALFGRLNYNWKDKYILNLSARRDGSSRFGSANRFHNFGAAGASWIFTEEPFIKNHAGILSFGKLKASYGTTGSDQISDYRYLDLYTSVFTGNPYQGIPTLMPSGLSNPYLQWEETKKMQFGLDVGLFNDRIFFTGNYYRNRCSNQLLYYDLPSMTGFGSISRNFPATVQNTGFELSLTTNNFRGNQFSWTTNFNITIPDSKLVAFPGIEATTYNNTRFIGKPITVSKVYKSLGVNDSTGLYEFADSKGNPVFPPAFPGDAIVYINSAPSFYGGLQNSFTWKGFQLDILFQFVKQTGKSSEFGNLAGVPFLNQPETVLGRWQKPGDHARIQRFSANYTLSARNTSQNFSDAVFVDASYARLKNLSLSWQIPDRWKQRLHLHGCSVYLQAQNLLTITGFKGMDPENLSNITLPPLRMITTGVQVGF